MRAHIFSCRRWLSALLLAGLAALTSPLMAAPQCGSIGQAYYELGALFYRTQDGSFAGIDKDVIEEIARHTGCRFEIAVESRCHRALSMCLLAACAREGPPDMRDRACRWNISI